MYRTALFPGSFDPVTLGHVDIIRRAIPLFEKLYVGIGTNAAKKTMFSLQQRRQWLEKLFEKDGKVKIVSYEGLTVDFCTNEEVSYIIRGIRSLKDFEYEKAIADMNGKLTENVETLLFFSSPEYGTLASTLVRDVLRNGGDVSGLLPKIVVDDLVENQYLRV